MTARDSEYKPLLTVEPVRWWRSPGTKKRLRSWFHSVAKPLGFYLDIFGFHQFFKSLWRRIVFLNLIGLVFVVGGVFYLSGFRASLLDLKVKSLEKQGEIIAAVISATTALGSRSDTGSDTDMLSLLYPDNSARNNRQGQFANVKFTLDPQKIAPMLEKTVELSNTRVRVYESDGNNLVDSNTFLVKGHVIRSLSSTEEKEQKRKGIFLEFTQLIARLTDRNRLPFYEDIGSANGKAYFEVERALNGQKTNIARVNSKHQTIVNVATPIKLGKKVVGVLLLTTKGVEIDMAVAAAREEIIRVAIVALVVSLILSIYMTGTIAGPMRSLSTAAKNVKKSIKARHEIPDLTHRPDEIGQLSSALREMTFALYKRMEAIESFAADVSHELKNPLTSLKSAVETLPLATRPEDREHLIEVILNDVSRLNRLITDIASASRLDAELARADMCPIDIAAQVRAIADIFNDMHSERNTRVVVEIANVPAKDKAFVISGHDGRMGQVFTNLLDNALSFSPEGGKVWIRVKRIDNIVEIRVEDQGPGVPEDNLEKIFARFYTDRPGEFAFRENSGLGLNISREIINAHKGTIRAENRYRLSPGQKYGDEAPGKPIGACFVVQLPAAFHLKGQK